MAAAGPEGWRLFAVAMKQEFPDNAGRTHKGGPWVPGVSGNPEGMKAGTRHRATRLAEKLMADDIEGVVKAVVTAAQGGDMQACKIVLDRIAPPCRGRPVRLDLPPIVGAADLVKALAAVADAMARGSSQPRKPKPLPRSWNTIARPWKPSTWNGVSPRSSKNTTPMSAGGAERPRGQV